MNEDDAAMMPELAGFTPGTKVYGKVTRVEDDGVFVDFGYKTEGKVPLAEWTMAPVKSLKGAVSEGDRTAVLLRDLGDPPRLSRKAAVDESTWRDLQERMEREIPFEVYVLSAIKGGLVADVEGVRGFLPASLVDLRFVGDLSPFVGERITVMATEVDPQDNRLILSRKKVLERTVLAEKEHILEQLRPGQRIEGVVARLTPFGAFVDLGGVDGLLHVSEMSWSRVERPEDVVRVGQHVSVTVLRVDPEGGRVSLSMKDMQGSPWTSVTEQFRPGDIVTGTVRRLTNFGAFVEVAPGIEGLVHVSQISDKRVETPADVLKPGQTVSVKILDIRPSDERMSLSIREAMRTQGQKRPAGNEARGAQPSAEPAPGTTLGDLFGDMLRDRFK